MERREDVCDVLFFPFFTQRFPLVFIIVAE